jgi:protein MpaA
VRPSRPVVLGIAAIALAGAAIADFGQSGEGDEGAARMTASFESERNNDGLSPIRTPGERPPRVGTVGQSSQGRPIRLIEHGDGHAAETALVFGCIHGDECAARHLRPVSGCPLDGTRIYTVPNLNPDGFALGTRLNSRGVDLNRNFPSGWRPMGSPGSPQHSGPYPFSEPETLLAARMIRALDPDVTIWFHQHRAARPLVRAWGQSVPMARRFAALANQPFERLPWLAGTAPNWQNHTFPDTASFVVELPRSGFRRTRLDYLGHAVVRLAVETDTD